VQKKRPVQRPGVGKERGGGDPKFRRSLYSLSQIPGKMQSTRKKGKKGAQKKLATGGGDVPITAPKKTGPGFVKGNSKKTGEKDRSWGMEEPHLSILIEKRSVRPWKGPPNQGMGLKEGEVTRCFSDGNSLQEEGRREEIKKGRRKGL